MSSSLPILIGAQPNIVYISWRGDECIEHYNAVVTNSSGGIVFSSTSFNSCVTWFSFIPTDEERYYVTIFGYDYNGIVAAFNTTDYRYRSE